jgi:hypothetical protein
MCRRTLYMCLHTTRCMPSQITEPLKPVLTHTQTHTHTHTHTHTYTHATDH